MTEDNELCKEGVSLHESIMHGSLDRLNPIVAEGMKIMGFVNMFNHGVPLVSLKII